MLDSDTPRTRRRMRILAVIIATIPCYCAGFIALSFAPDTRATATQTPSITETLASPDQNLSLTPVIATDTITPTFTATPTPTESATPTVSFTPFQPATDTPTFTSTPSNTPTLTPSSTPTPSNTPSNTPTFTPTQTPSNTPVPSPTAFGG
ncbi:MAG: hypothetical protein ACYC6R_03290 [Anaerolineales bacterium]